jgi:hypothetical protein
METEATEGSEATNTTTATTPREETRYPLAYDANGNPLQVPNNAVAWRVRRGGGKRGRPRNVFDASTGRQLELALGASIDDLIETNVHPDRYLLYPIDGQGSIIPGIVAVTEVPDTDDEHEGDERSSGERAALSVNSKDPIVALAASQHEVIKTFTEHFSRALGQAVSGYGTVRPIAPPAPAPIVMEAPAPAPAPATGAPNFLTELLNKPEQAIQLAMFCKQMLDMIKGAGRSGGGGIGGIGGAS